MGVVQAIVRLPNGTLNADCDYRKGGKPAGFQYFLAGQLVLTNFK